MALEPTDYKSAASDSETTIDYCMSVVVRDDLEDWICEGCLSKNDINSLNSGQAENVLDSSTKAYFDLWGQVPRKRQKAVETGKVKFLPTEEVIKLSSRLPLPKKAFPSNSNSGSKPVPANFTLSPSKRVFMGSKDAGPCYNPIKLGSENVPRGRGGRISASIRHQHSVEWPNKSKEDEEKASRTPAKQYGSNEEPVSSVMAANEVTGDVDSKATNTMKETLSITFLRDDISGLSESMFELSFQSAWCYMIGSIDFSIERAHLVPNKENVCKGKILDTILPNKELTVLHTKTEDAMRSSRPSPSRHHTTIMSSGKSNIHGAAEPENSDVPKTETWSRLKVSLYRPHAPSLHPTWM
ncbi:Histone deacetylase superfamily [Gossypium australe]|uniref:Histone deacetylase superfamily n=1 Tax=Gossypium australe TaxID=47621 RepID=A0A5B6V2M6_9ROSI|nr:Histone deacetylase superfamily [Gossypium australe]